MESIGEETAGPLELLLLLINPADILETFRTCNGQKLHIMENSIYIFFIQNLNLDLDVFGFSYLHILSLKMGP